VIESGNFAGGTSALTAIEVKSGKLKNVGGSLEFMRRYPNALGLTIGSGYCSIENFLEGKIALFK
jgi:hypothetical protein